MALRLMSIICLAVLLPGAAMAEGQPASGQSLKGATGCTGAGTAEPASQPVQGGGTAPGNSGSTGWSGGTGGSYIGTNPSGGTTQSKTWQPATARGLDPIGAPRPAADAC